MAIIYNKNRKKGLFYIPSGGFGPSVSAAFAYGKAAYNQSEADPTPTITGTAGGSFNASAGLVFVDTGTFNSSTGQIDLSASTIDSHIITYTVDGVQSGQTVGITAAPYSSTRSFSFDGTDDYMHTSNPSLGITNTWSISTWVKTDDKTADGNSFRGWFATGGWNIVSNFKIAVRSDNGYASVWEAGVQRIVGTSDITDNNWYNVVLTKTASDLTLFVNGSQQATVSNSSTWSFNNIYLGAGGQNTVITTAGMWNGNIDEVSIWNSALSSDAVTEIAAGPNDLESLTNASSSNLVAWYKMGE